MDIEKFLQFPNFGSLARNSTYDELYEKIKNLVPLLNQYYIDNPNKDLDNQVNNLIADYNEFLEILFKPKKVKK